MWRPLLLVGALVTVLPAQGPMGSPELRQAALDSSLPVLKALFEDLAIPGDLVYLRDRKEPLRIRPLPVALPGGTAATRGTIRLDPIQVTEFREEYARFPLADILKHGPYETVALARLDDFQKKQEALPALELLSASERVLAAVLRFHESERQDGLRKGPEWGPVREQLRTRLLQVRLTQLDTRIRSKDWEAALPLANRLLETYAQGSDGDATLADRMGLALLQLVDGIQADARLDAAQRLAQQERISQALQRFKTRTLAARPIDRLRQMAREAFRDAQTANDRTRTDRDRAAEHAARAQEALARAEKLWPDLEELRTFELNVQRSDSVLRIGVRELPQLFSPALAVTDDERRIVELIFEGLIEPRYDAYGELNYVPALAEARGVVIPQGRRFHLARNALWSDGKPVQPVDVRHSLQSIQAGKSDRSALTTDVLQSVDVVGDFRRVDLLFKRGTLDPLSPMTFKILPSGVDTASAAFARQPVGSGPYQFDGVRMDQGRSTLVLRANTQYAKRPGQSSLPLIRALHFVVSTDPLTDLERGTIDMALDLAPGQVGTPEQRQARRIRLIQPTADQPNRRVYFLAVNHGHEILKSVEFRRALAQSVDRAILLKGLGGTPIPGLYPPGTWAFNERENPKLNLYDPDLARAGFKNALKQAITLSLKIPQGDAALKAAFDTWTTEVKKLSDGNLTIEVQPVPARQLHREVTEGRYELAYWHHDHVDQTYWLGPLLGLRPQGQANLFRYTDDAVENWLNASRQHREFSKVVEITRLLATKLNTDMPLIPLWQITPTHLLHESVKVVDLDPQWIFPAVERWTLDRPNRP